MAGKGGAFERDISKFLTKWLTGKEKPFCFWRMPGSGSLSTIHEECMDLSGDIRAITKEAALFTEVFSIECKVGYPKTSFWQHFTDIKNFNIKDFWIQCCNDAKKSNKFPMLIYRKKNKTEIVGISGECYYYVQKIIPNISDIQSLVIKFNKEDNLDTLMFFNMKKFFELINMNTIKKLNKIKGKNESKSNT
jgi:hypothetical protein